MLIHEATEGSYGWGGRRAEMNPWAVAGLEKSRGGPNLRPVAPLVLTFTSAGRGGSQVNTDNKTQQERLKSPCKVQASRQSCSGSTSSGCPEWLTLA